MNTRGMQCAGTRLCDTCGEDDCKYNVRTAQTPVQEQVRTVAITKRQHDNALRKLGRGTAKQITPQAREDTMSGKKLTLEEFTLKCIDVNKEQTGYDGMHTVWSAYNRAVREYFGMGKDEVVEAVNTMISKSKAIKMMPWKGGPKLYRTEDMPTSKGGDGNAAKAQALIASATK